MKRAFGALFAVLAIVSLWTPPLAAPSIVGPATLKNQGGAVTVEAKYLAPSPAGAGDAIRFEIKLDAHSVNLDQ